MTGRIIDTDEVRRIAHLARLTLGSGEAERLAGELEAILDYISRIAELEPGIGAPGADPAPEGSGPLLLRSDEPHACLASDKVERMAPRFARGHFVVPRVVERD